MATISFLSSTLFKVIGPGKTAFNVHGELLAKRSKVLAKDVNGTMRENQTKTIEIEAVDGDVDDDTTMRFLEYVYTGDYPVPEPVVLQLSSDPKEVTKAFYSKERALAEPFKHYPLYEPPSPVTYDSSSEVKSRGKGKVMGQKEPGSQGTGNAAAIRDSLWEIFCESVNVREPQKWLPPFNNDQREDFTPVFLCHARLYRLADRYNCPELMGLTLRRLHLTLSRYQFHQERASAIVELIRYTYLHTMQYDASQEKLRLLVLDYATCWIQELSKDQNFVEMCKRPGSVASDLLFKLVGLIE